MNERERADEGDSRHERAETPAKGTTAVVRCELCGGPVIDRHCKLVCRNCGYQRDCSDP